MVTEYETTAYHLIDSFLIEHLGLESPTPFFSSDGQNIFQFAHPFYRCRRVKMPSHKAYDSRVVSITQLSLIFE